MKNTLYNDTTLNWGSKFLHHYQSLNLELSLSFVSRQEFNLLGRNCTPQTSVRTPSSWPQPALQHYELGLETLM